MKKVFLFALPIIVTLIYFLLGVCSIETNVEQLEMALSGKDTNAMDAVTYFGTDVEIEYEDMKIKGNYADVKKDMEKAVVENDFKVTLSLLNSKDKLGLFTNTLEGSAFVSQGDNYGELHYRITFLNIPFKTIATYISIK